MNSAGSGMSVPANRTERAEFLPLAINPALVERILIGFIQDEVRKVGFQRVVIGLSGGVDSSLAATLAARALGPKNVKGLLMPYRLSDPRSRSDAEAVVRQLGIAHELVDISPQIDPYFARYPDAEPARRGNKMARERVTILYDHSWAWQALVLGTSNKTELLLGYGTIYGDTASALNPLGDLYKTQVRMLALHLGLPDAIVWKTATADLWAGQSDEAELGYRYAEIDRLLVLLVDHRVTPRDAAASGFPRRMIERLTGLIERSQFKRRPPLIAKLSQRTVGIDFRYPRDWGR